MVVLTNQQKLFLMLAQGIADVLLPVDAPKAAGIADDAPAITARLRKVVAGMAKGSVDPALFTEEAQRELVLMLYEWGPVTTGLYKPLTRLELLEDSARDGKRTRTYRVYFGTMGARYRAMVASDGRFERLEPTPE